MITKSLRHYLIAGLIVWLPILVTFMVFRFVIELLDSTISLIPSAYRPEHLFGLDIPGLGVVFSLAVLLITGMVATNFFGQRLVSWGESILARIPLVRSIYNAVKQVINAIFSTNSQAFRKVVLIEYPRKGLWSIAFLTGTQNQQLNNQLGEEVYTLFIPTTPNPTSGFLIMVPKSQTTELEMTIDEALKFVISLGVMHPNSNNTPAEDSLTTTH